MLKPVEFQQAQVTLQKLPYALLDSACPDGGVLDRGQVVWTKPAGADRDFTRTLGYVEGVGIVSLSSRALVRADILKPEPSAPKP